jgi:uncharacterized protein involved in exopolysaccharide biosynthesis
MKKEQFLDPFYLIGRLVNNWPKVFAGAVICAVAALGWTFMSGETFQASATLVLLPPPFKTTQSAGLDEVSALMPKTMEVYDYQILLSSDSVLFQVKQAMDVYSDSPDGFSMRGLRKHLTISIKSRNMGQRGPQESPVITLVARATTAELATQFANTWASISQKTVAEASVQSTSGSLTFLTAEYKGVTEVLVKAENDHQTCQDGYDDRITLFSDETDTLITAFQNETDTLVDGLTDEWNKKISELNARLAPERKQEGLAVQMKKLSEFETTLIQVKKDKSDTEEELKQLAAELDEHPKLQIVAKAITDDALWNSVVGKEGVSALPNDLDAKKLRSEEINPVYEQLVTRLASVRVEMKSLPKEEQYVSAQIKNIREQHDTLLAELRENEFQIDEADRQKVVDIANLTRERARGETELTRNREKGLTILTREATLEIERLEREVINQRASFDALAGKYLSAKLAAADKTTDMIQTGMAVPDPRPISGGSKLVPTVAGAIVGAMLGIAFVAFEIVVREVVPSVMQ